MKNVLKRVALLALLVGSFGLANAQQKIGHINYSQIFMETSDYKAAEKTLTDFQGQKEKELQEMVSILQKKQADGQEIYRNLSDANRDSLTVKLNTLGQEIQEIEQRITTFRDQAEEEIVGKQNELFAPIHQKINNILQTLAKEKGYAYVFDISTVNIPYYQGGDDLTNEVKTKLGITTTATK
jgi:outer membrane protein